jgi:hypothetical protein
MHVELSLSDLSYPRLADRLRAGENEESSHGSPPSKQSASASCPVWNDPAVRNRTEHRTPAPSASHQTGTTPVERPEPLSILGRITRSIATIRARCDMDEVTGLHRFEAVPDTAWHDVRVAGPQ